MAVFRCKMCGGTLEINGESVVFCAYCGTQQTLPRLDDERKATLIDRANHFRRNNEFDKAMGLYEQILNEDKTDAESYWSLILCKYGIEYVEDPATRKRIPTVNRAQFTSIYDDENYKSALYYADVVQKAVYEREAAAINEIQKNILAISGKEEPFDVFICYKETDDHGRRTPDSVIAQDIYKALTAEGLKVFFARITLEDKLGSAYEPYIFSALHSAKVMLAVGTKKEHFNAAWVKNEWNRFLALIRTDEKKVLIPCYKDMDAYELPEEFSHLQAQDMSKLGFIQDLARGVRKIVGSTEATPAGAGASPTAESLLNRVFVFLEDKNWKSADEYCEKLLDMDVTNAKAYLGKLMAELKVSKREELKNLSVPFDTSVNYQKILRFGDDVLKAQLASDLTEIRERQEQQRLSRERLAEQQRLAQEQLAMQMRLEQEQFARQQQEENQRLAQQKLAEQEEQKKKRKGAVLALFLVLLLVVAIVTVSTLYNPNMFTDIVAVSAGGSHTVGLRSDGTVMYTGPNVYDQKKVAEWEDITAVSVSGSHIVGLKENGTVVAVGRDYSGQCNVSDWEDMIAVSAGGSHTVGLKEDGTVLAVGVNTAGQCNVDEWEDIVAIAAGEYHTVGVKEDGTVVATGSNTWRQCNVDGWEDIVSVSAGSNHTVGLKKDGTVVAAGRNEDGTGQCNVSDWEDITEICAGSNHTVGLKEDGTVVTTGADISGMQEVDEWEDIVAIGAGLNHTLGVKEDGTVVAVGSESDGTCDVGRWKK